MTRKWILCVPILLLAAHGSAFGGTDADYRYTYLAGPLPDTLHIENSPFMVLADVSVTSTFVEPGVQIFFTSGTKLILSSAVYFECSGTEDNPIGLHDAGLGAWRGVVFVKTGGPVQPIHIRVSYAEVSGAVEGIAFSLGCSLPEGDFYLENLTISNCSDGGLLIWGPSPVRTLSIVGIVSTGSPLGINVNYWAFVPTLQDCHVFGNGKGFSLYAPAIITEGSSYNNSYGFFIVPELTGPGLIVNSCSIRNNASYDVYVACPVMTFPSLDFRYNDWGPTTTAEMEAEGTFSDISTIYDWWDNHSYSIVDYSGFSGGSTGVPASNMVPASWGEIKKAFR